jgi:hypothetical protein
MSPHRSQAWQSAGIAQLIAQHPAEQKPLLVNAFLGEPGLCKRPRQRQWVNVKERREASYSVIAVRLNDGLHRRDQHAIASCALMNHEVV